jgi:hypothetical protein
MVANGVAQAIVVIPSTRFRAPEHGPGHHTVRTVHNEPVTLLVVRREPP